MTPLDDLAKTAAKRLEPDRASPSWTGVAAKMIADTFRPLTERAAKLESMLRRIGFSAGARCLVCNRKWFQHDDNCKLAALLTSAPPQVFPESTADPAIEKAVADFMSPMYWKPESPTPEPASEPTIPGWELLPSPVLARDLADAQQVNGRWYRPLFGCDSLAEAVERLAWLRAEVARLRAWKCPDCGLYSGSAATLVAENERLKQQLEETEHNLAEYRHGYTVVEKRAEQAKAEAAVLLVELRRQASFWNQEATLAARDQRIGDHSEFSIRERDVMQILRHSIAGTALLARVKKLEAVADAAKVWLESPDCKVVLDRFTDMKAALAALDVEGTKQ